MFKKYRVAFAATLLAVSAMSAAPANAYNVWTFFDANNQYVGYIMYCDGGSILDQWGTFTDVYTITYYPNGPC